MCAVDASLDLPTNALSCACIHAYMSDLNLRRVGFGGVITGKYELAKRQVVDKLQHMRWDMSDQAPSLRSGLTMTLRQIFYVALETTLVHHCSHIHHRWAEPDHTHRLVVNAIESSDVTRPAHTHTHTRTHTHARAHTHTHTS